MASFRLLVTTPRPADDALARLLDPMAHTRAIPLTVVTGSMTAPGDRFVARTSVGPFGFDDPMVVTEARRTAAGGVVGIGKEGRVVTGRVRAEVRPHGSGSVVDWRQEIGIGLLPRWTDPVVALVARLAYGAALRRIVG